jgi:protein-disulfide isomerase/uncharacterized membrane protein
MKLKLALLFILAAIGVHVYLTLHFYGLTFGTMAGESICNLNAKFNCDTVTASSFSSLAGVPIALWGAATNGVLGLLVLIWIFGWSNDVARLGRYAMWLSGFTAAMSLVMGSISTFFIGSYCIFCMSVYVLSFIIFYLIWRSQSPDRPGLLADIKALFGPAKSYLIFLAAIPAATFFLHRTFIVQFGAEALDNIVQESLQEWKAAPTIDLASTPAALVKEQSDVKMTIAEFADFRCGHCKHASPTLHAFLNSHPNVKFQYYTFPLDGQCNDIIPGGDGVSCYLAKNVYCAEKTAKKGWELHDAVYADQDDVNNGGMEAAKKVVEKSLGNLGVEPEAQKTCVESPDTDAAIRAQAKLGVAAGVKGTPTFYVNGRKLSRGQLLPVLEAVYKEL